MQNDRLVIDKRTIDDNPNLRQVEFEAEYADDRYQFAVHYDVLEAIGTNFTEASAQRICEKQLDEIARIGVGALARANDDGVVLISEIDLD